MCASDLGPEVGQVAAHLFVPVEYLVLHHDAGKWFASFYALFSGVVFLVMCGVIFAPVVHRFLHKFHLDVQSKSK